MKRIERVLRDAFLDAAAWSCFEASVHVGISNCRVNVVTAIGVYVSQRQQHQHQRVEEHTTGRTDSPGSLRHLLFMK